MSSAVETQAEGDGTEVEALRAEVVALRAQVAALTELVARVPGRDRASESPPDPVREEQPEHQPGVGRRAALRTGVAMAAGAAGLVVGSARPAAAANGDPLTLGSANNAATNPTALNVSGGKKAAGLRVSDVGYSGFAYNSAIFANAQSNTFDAAIAARAFGTAAGLVVDADGGAAATLENSWNGPTLRSTNRGSGPALQLSSSSTGPALRMGAGGNAPPTRSASYQAGDIVLDLNRILWVCVANGTPGTWRRLAGPASAGAFHPLAAPTRVYDSRPGTAPAVGAKTPLAANTARTLDCTANGSGVPAGALGVLATLLVVDTTRATGNMTLWANGAPAPSTNNVLWTRAGDRASVLTYTGLDSAGRCQVRANQVTHVVLDVVGYYR